MNLRYIAVLLALFLAHVTASAQSHARIQHEFVLVSVDFGRVPIGVTKDTTVTAFIRNTSFNPATVLGIRLGGEHPENFALVDIPDMPLVIAPADSAAFRFSFTPSVLELVQASLEVITAHDTTVAILFGGGLVADVRDEPGVADAGMELRCVPSLAGAGATIEYAVPRRCRAHVTVVDMLGRRVATVLDRDVEPGRHVVPVDLAGLPAGSYRCVLAADGLVRTAEIRVVR